MGESSWLQLLDALLELGPEGGTREHLVHKAGVSTASFYRAIKPLLGQGLVEEHEGRYTLPLSNFHNYRYKLWRDADRLHRLPSFVRDYVLDLLSRCLQEQGENLLVLWLVGSAAQDTMHAGSDLDFLAVLDAQPEIYHPLGQFDMNFVAMDKDEFQKDFADREGFVLTVLRHGLVLHDRGFAQPYLSAHHPVEIDVPRFYEEEKILERLKQRLFFFIKEKEDEEIRKWLNSYAVNLARMVLRLYGFLPAGKHDLIESAGAFVGAEFAETLRQAIWNDEPAQAMHLYHRLDDYRYLFHENASHLKRYAAMVSAPSLEFEELCRQLFAEMIGDRRIERLHGSDFVFQHGKRSVLVECKSLTRTLTEEHLHQLAERPNGTERMIVVNAYRDLPVPERPDPLSDKFREQAEAYSIRVMSAPDLLRLYTLWRLRGGSPAEGLSALGLTA